MVELKAGEKAEPLGDGYYIVQNENGYRFGSDAVALAHFAAGDVTARDKVLDLCSGCGIIAIMLGIATNAEVVGVELDEELYGMSLRSLEINKLNTVSFINADARALDNSINGQYDAVVCNPPYYKVGSKPTAVAPTANSEINITLSDVVAVAGRALKVGGALYMTHVTSRLDEVICACRDNGLAVKKLVVNPNGKTSMVRAVRGGKQGMILKVEGY